MSSNSLPSAESDFLQAYTRNTELRAQIEEASLALLQEISARQGRLEMALMRDAAQSGVERSGATGRLDVLGLRLAELKAALNEMQAIEARREAMDLRRESSIVQIATNVLTLQRQVHDLSQWLAPWYVRVWDWLKGGKE